MGPALPWDEVLPVMRQSEGASRTVDCVYVHVPFCPRRCHYCDFPVSPVARADLDGWRSALRWNLYRVEEEGIFTLAPTLGTLFVGGGTPSFLGPGAMGELARILDPRRLQGGDLEWTAEANPESLSPDVIRDWTEAGVNRVSLGVQSFDDRSLRWLGRGHGSQEAQEGIGRTRRGGLENLSIDLIFGLPRDLGRDWARDLDRTLSLGIPHLSLYGLSVETETPLGRAAGRGEVILPTEEEYAEEYLLASQKLSSEGYHHYEVSNFALPGFEARHNRSYWDRRPYLGLGNGAHSYSQGLRRWNLRDWAAYQEACRRGMDPWSGEEELSESQIRLETIWLSLRTDRGLIWSSLSERGRALAEGWIGAGKARWESGILRLSPGGWLVLDDLAVAMEVTESSASSSPRPGGSGEEEERGMNPTLRPWL